MVQKIDSGNECVYKLVTGKETQFLIALPKDDCRNECLSILVKEKKSLSNRKSLKQVLLQIIKLQPPITTNGK